MRNERKWRKAIVEEEMITFRVVTARRSVFAQWGGNTNENLYLRTSVVVVFTYEREHWFWGSSIW